MANIASIPLTLTIVGDGVSLTATVVLSFSPVSVSLVSSFDASTGTDQSGNVSSVVVSGSNIVFTFNATFTDKILVTLALNYTTAQNPMLQMVAGTVSTKTELNPATSTSAVVGLASAQVVAANSTRTGLVLINTGPSHISLGFGSVAVLNSGVTLNPMGGTYEMDEFMFFNGAVSAIASSASGKLSIQEYS